MAVLLSGCAVGGAEPGRGTDEGQALEARSALGEKAEVVTRNKPAGQVAAGRSRRPAGRGESKAEGTGPATGGAPSTTGQSSREGGAVATGHGPSVRLAQLQDPRGDHGNGPGYADLTGVDFRGDQSTLTVTITVDAAIPAHLDRGEVQGVGIDLFRSSSDESDYQVFLDGGRDGWTAYLQGPDGFVEYPGGFGVADHAFVVRLPWTAVGGRRDADVSLFVDWSSGSGGTSNDTTPRADLPTP
jgi:hypothetical protein